MPPVGASEQSELVINRLFALIRLVDGSTTSARAHTWIREGVEAQSRERGIEASFSPAASTRSATPLWPLLRDALEALAVISLRPPPSPSAVERAALFVVRGVESFLRLPRVLRVGGRGAGPLGADHVRQQDRVAQARRRCRLATSPRARLPNGVREPPQRSGVRDEREQLAPSG